MFIGTVALFITGKTGHCAGFNHRRAAGTIQEWHSGSTASDQTGEPDAPMPLLFFFFFRFSGVQKKKRNKKNAGGRVMITGDETPFVCGESCVWLCALKKPPGPAHPPHILAGRLPPNGSRLSKESRPPPRRVCATPGGGSREFSSSSEVSTLS